MNKDTASPVYQERLVQIFKSCDSGNKGYLSLLEFERLCRQLHLQHQKHRLYNDLGLDKTSPKKQVFFDDFIEAFLSLLQEVGPETLTSGDQNFTDSQSQAPRSLRHYGRNSQTSLEDDVLRLNLPPGMTTDDSGLALSGVKGQRKLPTSPPSPLKRAFLEKDGGGHVRVGKHRKSGEGQVETFEAEGQLAASPEPDSHALDSATGLEQLRHLCSKLGIGHHGYLTQGELARVCQFIGMEQMDDEELEELFNKLDMDHDGFISFDEFVSGLSRHSSSRSYSTPTRTQAPLHPLSARKARTPLPPAQQDRGMPSTCVSGDAINLFSSLESSFTGYAKGEEIVDYWEHLGVGNGASILVSLGFDPQSKILLKELSASLVSEWAGQISSEDVLGHAFSATYRNELAYLKSALDQTGEERDKLRSDLTDALSRNGLLAAEVDEHHAQLEKSYEAKLQSLEQHHTEQVRNLQTQLEKEKEAQSSQSAILKQTSEQIQGLQQQVTSLQERLTAAQADAASAREDLKQAQEKQSEWELQYNRLKKEMQQQQQQQSPLDSPSSLSWEQERRVAMETAERCATENKELKDHNDELVAHLEELKQRLSTGHRQGSTGSLGGSSQSHIPVFTRASSISSEASEMDDDLLSSTEGFFYNRHNVMAATEHESGEKPQTLSSELQQQQRMKRGERRERERKEIEHAYRLEIAELEDRFQAEKAQILQNFDKEKTKLSEEFHWKLTQRLAEQQKELQNAFTMEKQDLLQQYESRINFLQLQAKELTQKIRQEIQEESKQQSPNRTSSLEKALSLKIEGLEEEKDELEKKLEKLRSGYEAELQMHRIKSEQQLAEVRASVKERVESELQRVFSQGVSALEGKLKEDFHHLVQQQQQHHQQQQDDQVSSDGEQDKEELYASFEREKLALVNHYESQIVALQEELGAFRQDFEAERAAFRDLQSGDLAQAIRQEMQDEVRGQVDQLRQSWEEERQELSVQNQLLEEELTDMKGLLMQERQRAAEAHMLRETVRHLRAENKEVGCMAESLKEKLARGHQQLELERANFERRIDELEREKERALRLQALQNAGPISSDNVNTNGEMQKEVLEKVIQQVESVDRSGSPPEQQTDQGALDQLQGEITKLNHQLQEARTAQFEFQQLKEECDLLHQSNINLEKTVRTLRQRAEKDQTERKREEQEQLYDFWEEQKKLQNLLQRTTDKLLKTSSEMAAGQTHLVREVEQLKQKAGNMVELETFTGLQRSLLETQRHAISLQEALTERTQLTDKIMAEAEKERRQERDAWEEERRDMQGRLDATVDMYRSLALQHKKLRQSSTKLGALVKDLYAENADLMNLLQQTENKQRSAQRRCRKLQERCQAWHDAVYRMYHAAPANRD